MCAGAQKCCQWVTPGQAWPSEQDIPPAALIGKVRRERTPADVGLLAPPPDGTPPPPLHPSPAGALDQYGFTGFGMQDGVKVRKVCR